MLHTDEAKKANREALKKIVKLTTRARHIDREVSSAKIKLEKLQKEQAEIYGKLSAFSDPNKPDTTDTDDEPTETHEAPVTHTLAV
jgi:hypothetical protein